MQVLVESFAIEIQSPAAAWKVDGSGIPDEFVGILECHLPVVGVGREVLFALFEHVVI